jgi:hypothetical protein
MIQFNKSYFMDPMGHITNNTIEKHFVLITVLTDLAFRTRKMEEYVEIIVLEFKFMSL